ncbi:MAG: hypothetical protein MZV65_21830 [Chromatiales bacterium]|nr:hypothetical protein [Chromatiales bacterium]
MRTTTPSLSDRLKPRMSAWLLLAFTPVAMADGSPWYLRGGLSWVTSSHEHLTDENCANHSPPALFGCSLGSDGRPIGAYGRLDDALGWDLGVGYRLSPIWRLELGYERVADRSFSGEANFLSVPGCSRSRAISTPACSWRRSWRISMSVGSGWFPGWPWARVGPGMKWIAMTYRVPWTGPGRGDGDEPTASRISSRGGRRLAWASVSIRVSRSI